MAKKKTYVLYVVHTDLHQPGEFTYAREILTDKRVSNKELSAYFEEFNKRFKLDKKSPELHREGVVEAIKIFQEAGMPVIYEPGTAHGETFLKFVEQKGVKKDEIIINKIESAAHDGPHLTTAVARFLMKVKKLGIDNIEDFEVVFVGHYTDLCVWSRAGLLKQRGMHPYLVIGTPAKYFGLDNRKTVLKFFGKDRVITLHQLRRLLNG